MPRSKDRSRSRSRDRSGSRKKKKKRRRQAPPPPAEPETARPLVPTHDPRAGRQVRKGWPHKRRPATEEELQDFINNATYENIKTVNNRTRSGNLSESALKRQLRETHGGDLKKLAQYVGLKAHKEKTAERALPGRGSLASRPVRDPRAVKRETVEAGARMAAKAKAREAATMKREEVDAARRRTQTSSTARNDHGSRAAPNSSGSVQPVTNLPAPPEDSSEPVQARKRRPGDGQASLPSQSTASSATADIRNPPHAGVRPAIPGGAPAVAPPAPPPAPERAAPPVDAPAREEAHSGFAAPTPRPRKRKRESESDYAPTPTHGRDTTESDDDTDEKPIVKRPPRRSGRARPPVDYGPPPSPAHSASDLLPAHRSKRRPEEQEPDTPHVDSDDPDVTHMWPPSGAPPVRDPASDPALTGPDDRPRPMPNLEAVAAKRTTDALAAAGASGAAPSLPQTDEYAVGRLSDHGRDEEPSDAPEARVVGRRKPKPKPRPDIPESKQAEAEPEAARGTVTQTQTEPAGRQVQVRGGRGGPGALPVYAHPRAHREDRFSPSPRRLHSFHGPPGR